MTDTPTDTPNEYELGLLATMKDLDPATRKALMYDPKVGWFSCPQCGCRHEVTAIYRDYMVAEITIGANGQTAATIGFAASGPVPVEAHDQEKAARQSAPGPETGSRGWIDRGIAPTPAG